MLPKKRRGTGLVDWLNKRGAVVYIAPAIPALLLFVLSMITASIYGVYKSEYQICKANTGSDSWLGSYILGTIILNYSFILIYANMIMEFLKILSGIVINFLMFILFFIVSFAWSIIGVIIIHNSKCTTTKYYKIALINIILFFVSFGGIVLYSCFILARVRYLKRQQRLKEEEKKKKDIQIANETKEKLTEKQPIGQDNKAAHISEEKAKIPDIIEPKEEQQKEKEPSEEAKTEK